MDGTALRWDSVIPSMETLLPGVGVGGISFGRAMADD